MEIADIAEIYSQRTYSNRGLVRGGAMGATNRIISGCCAVHPFSMNLPICQKGSYFIRTKLLQI